MLAQKNGGNLSADVDEYFPDFVEQIQSGGTKESATYADPNRLDTANFENDSMSSSSEEEQVPENAHWKTKEYYRLPKNVQSAIDSAEMKKQHT